MYVFNSIGKYDLIIEVEPESEDHLDEIIKSINDEFARYIVNYETIEVKEEHQMDYFKISK